MQKNDNNPQLLAFPCEFPIKILGINSADLLPEAIAIISKHDKGFNPQANITTTLSSEGKYLAITATITAISKQQLDAIYGDLTRHKLVKFVL